MSSLTRKDIAWLLAHLKEDIDDIELDLGKHGRLDDAIGGTSYRALLRHQKNLIGIQGRLVDTLRGLPKEPPA